MSGSASKFFLRFLRYHSNLRKACSQLCITSIQRKYYSVNCNYRRSENIVGFLNYNSIRSSQSKAMAALSPQDPSSFSQPDVAVMKHASFNLEVDFTEKILKGSVALYFDVIKSTDNIVLDVRNQVIKSIEFDDITLAYTITNDIPDFGSKLTIILPKTVKPGHGYTKLERINCLPSCRYGKPGPSDSGVSLALAGHVVRIIPEGASQDIMQLPVCNCCTCAPDYCYCGKAESGKNCSRLKVNINYQTAPNASGLQWLQANQTSGKKHPYLFSQCQPIHARSVFPCQDTPAVKFTYDAEVSAPLGYTILMSALRTQESGVTKFSQPVPIPSYLVAIAVGMLESRRLGPRSLVWSEAEEIESCASEFADTEKYLEAAERLCGPYVWTQYDLLVLPSSFPYGGMENPCLTFVTPTLLAGDKSQADVIVHEIMHSWTGNLVTNRNFEHFWLNEGFTVFLERKVAASLIEDMEEAQKSRDFHSLLGLSELKETVISELGIENPLTALVVNLKGLHPDDAFSVVPYEKGSLFLRYLEELVGGPEIFDHFLRSYLDNFKEKSLDTNDFKFYLLDYFKDLPKETKLLKEVDWDRWLHVSGMPPIIPNYDTSMTKAVTDLLSSLEGGSINDTVISQAKEFTPHQMLHFLQEMLELNSLTVDNLEMLGKSLELDTTKNSELQYRWFRLCIRSKAEDRLAEVFNFLNSQGRMKFSRPLYRDLYAWEEVRQVAIDNFLENEPFMMHVAAYTLRKDLHLRADQTVATSYK